jgi:GMP synthase (glutamine-hydrolysing)
MQTPAQSHEKVLIVDFGSQVTQLIARRVRESGVYCEIHPYDKAEAMLEAFRPQGHHPVRRARQRAEDDSPRIGRKLFEMGVPVLGICYGEQLLCDQLGGKVEGGHTASSAAPRSPSARTARCSPASATAASRSCG